MSDAARRTEIKPLTGLFLGAGFSVEAGMPLAWDLTAEIKNWLTGSKLRELSRNWRTMGNGPPELRHRRRYSGS